MPSPTHQPAAKPTMLFIHGFLDGAAAWDEVIEALSPSAEGQAVDLAGMGSRAAEGGPYTLERFAQDVGRELEALGKPVVLVGHSMGAQVAELVAARHPSKVGALVLVTPVPLAGPHLPDQAMASFRALGGQPTAQRDLRRHLAVSLTEDKLERLGVLGDRPTPDSVAAFADAWGNGHPDGAEHSKYVGPVLIVAGEGDRFINAEMIASAVVPRFEAPVVATLSQAGHWPHVEQPGRFANALSDFMQSLASARASGTPRQGWTRAFENKSADAFAKAFAPDIVLEASVLAKQVVGLEQVKIVMANASKIYEALAFTHEATNGQRSYLEWEAKAFGGETLRGVTILTKNTDGQIVHAAIHHRPLEAALKFSVELGKRVSGRIGAEHFYSVQ